MCSELCKDFYVVYQLEMVAGEVESSCELVVTFFFLFYFFFYFFLFLFIYFFFGLTLPNYRNKSGSAQRSPPHINYFLRRCSIAYRNLCTMTATYFNLCMRGVCWVALCGQTNWVGRRRDLVQFKSWFILVFDTTHLLHGNLN